MCVCLYVRAVCVCVCVCVLEGLHHAREKVACPSMRVSIKNSNESLKFISENYNRPLYWKSSETLS